jgi:hypothetical protein
MSSAETPDSERRTMLRFAAMGLAAPLLGCSGSEWKATAPSSTPRWRHFDNKVVLITGATSGIGRAAAFQFAAEGGKVGFCGRRQYPGLGRPTDKGRGRRSHLSGERSLRLSARLGRSSLYDWGANGDRWRKDRACRMRLAAATLSQVWDGLAHRATASPLAPKICSEGDGQ